MRGFVVVVALVSFGLALTARAGAATFTVNSTLDTDDKSADGLCRDANNKCTLRAAITEANRDPGADIIIFGITGSGTKSIALVSEPVGAPPTPLSITSAVTIDATTQNGYAAGAPVIEIDGSAMGGDAFIVSSLGCEIRGLRIRQFAGAAISVTGAGACVIRSNHFVSNQVGVQVDAPISSTVIGGALATDRNVFSTQSISIYLTNGASGLKILGNYIGTDVSGAVGAGSTTYGIWIQAGSAEIRNNVIAASPIGVVVTTATLPTTIADNLIGTDAAGTSALGNGIGIRVIAGPTQIVGNTIAGNNSYGINLNGPQCIGTEIKGNRIGTSVTGVALTNSTGIWIENQATGSIIGGTQAGEPNVISGNSWGIVISSNQSTFDLATQTRDHLIVGNYIGVLADGTTARPNQTGVWIGNAARNRVEENTISGNSSAGVVVAGFMAKDNSLRKNSIFGNGGIGIDLENDNVTPNDTFDTDTGANDHQNFPVIATGTDDANTFVGGTLEATPGGAFEIDFYTSPTCGNRNAKQYLWTTTVFTNGNGQASMMVPFTKLPDGTAITATATSASGATSELSACVTTAACTPVELETTIADGSVGVSYFQLLQATSPFVVQEVEVTGGALPPGLSLLETGELSGIPEAAGTYSFTVRVIDTRGCVSFSTLTIRICAFIAITPDAIGPLPRAFPFELQLMASGGTPPYQYFVVNGPDPLPGMTLSSSGLLQGTPYLDGTFNFYVTATDQASCTGTQGYSISVGCLSLDISPNDLPVADLGAPYNVQLVGSGGLRPYRFEVGMLPPGLELSSEGVLAGTPRERGSTVITVTMTDSYGCREQISFTLVVDVSNPPGCDCASGGQPSSLLVIAFVLVVTLRRRRVAVTA